MFFADPPHLVTVQTLTVSQDASGGTVETYTAVATDVPCLISQGTGSRISRFDQQPIAERITVTGTDASLGMPNTRIVVVSGPRAGKTFRVTGVSEHGPVGMVDQFFRATCELLEG